MMMNRFVSSGSLHRLAARRRIPCHPTYLSNHFCTSSVVEDKHETPSIPDYFETLGVERTFAMDTLVLKRRYKQLMEQLHPDKHRDRPDVDQEEIHNKASQVTHAYRVLQSPHDRALHLLRLLGKVSIDDESTTMDNMLLGVDLLMEIMEIREAIESATDDKAIQRLWDDNQERIQKTVVKLQQAFDREDLDDALQLAAKLQYWNRAKEVLKDKSPLLIR